MQKHRLVILMMTLLLAMAALPATAQTPALSPAPEGSFSPIQAVVASALNGASNLTNTPDDYDVPQGFYFNGTPLTIIAVEPTRGNYPVELSAPEQLWARVRIGQQGDYAGIEGMMPLENLSLTQKDSPATQITARLKAVSPLYLDNGLSQIVLAEYPAGTDLQVMGWLLGWAHVAVEGQTGFVRPEALALEGDAAQALQQALPVDFDQIQPGYQERYGQYMDALMALYDKHGDSNHWPLAVNAQASQLAREAGYLFTDVEDVLPGQDDLSEEQAIQAGQAVAQSLYGLEADSWASASLAFFHEPGLPQEPQWKISLWGREGVPDVKVWLNKQGETIDTMIAHAPAGTDEGALAQPRETLDYYFWGLETQPREEEMDAETARELAWSIFEEDTGELDRAAFSQDAYFFTNDEGDLRWWLVSILKDLRHEVTVHYHVAMLMPDGQPVYHTSAEDYAQDLVWAENLAEFYRLEEQKGPFHSWSLEEKAAWEPEYFGLPQAGDLSQEQALAIARSKVKADYQLSDSDLEQFEPAFYFISTPQRVWQVTFIQKNPIQHNEAPGYTCIIDAVTGEVQDVFANELEGPVD